MKHCKVCFKEIDNEIFINDLLNVKEHELCYECFNKMELVLKNIRILDYKIFILLKYNSYIKELIYKFKGLYDIELKNIFLEYFKDIIEEKYQGYTLTFAPSSKEDDLKRGFNHVKEMFSFWKGDKRDCFYKKNQIKQSSRNHLQRKEIVNDIGLNLDALKGVKKLLIVDDIVTTGNTINVCANLVKKHKNIKIKLLSICISKF